MPPASSLLSSCCCCGGGGCFVGLCLPVPPTWLHLAACSTQWGKHSVGSQPTLASIVMQRFGCLVLVRIVSSCVDCPAGTCPTVLPHCGGLRAGFSRSGVVGFACLLPAAAAFQGDQSYICGVTFLYQSALLAAQSRAFVGSHCIGRRRSLLGRWCRRLQCWRGLLSILLCWTVLITAKMTAAACVTQPCGPAAQTRSAAAASVNLPGSEVLLL
ncbi:hypothetical protein COO60DRAFT_35799 [Scenedesmus sp. NREL 46B-D3]|nr:hypothetical protein COO60DRAFT_35799 [Scenedesmus sp. NREL 46B-D3]